MTQSLLKFYVIAYASGHKGNQLAYNLITEKKKTRWLHNWPTKPTSFVPWNWTYKQLRIKKSNEDYIIGSGHWKLKKFPPNKNKYSLNRLLIVKFKKRQV